LIQSLAKIALLENDQKRMSKKYQKFRCWVTVLNMINRRRIMLPPTFRRFTVTAPEQHLLMESKPKL